jgi:hypothetical protein
MPHFGLTCRQGAGIPLLGKSSNYPPARPNSRIDFAFDRAAFYFSFLPFSIPYPVPFRLLGDERKVGLGLDRAGRCEAGVLGQFRCVVSGFVCWFLRKEC